MLSIFFIQYSHAFYILHIYISFLYLFILILTRELKLNSVFKLITDLPLNDVRRLQACLYCTICAIELADASEESSWDDRQTEVRWTTIHPDSAEGEIKAEALAKKVVESINEPSHKVIPETTKCIQLLLNATVTLSE